MIEQIALNEGISFDVMIFEALKLAARIAKNCNGACSITFLTLYYFHKNNKIAGKSRESYLSLISLRSLILFLVSQRTGSLPRIFSGHNFMKSRIIILEYKSVTEDFCFLLYLVRL